MWWLNNLNSIFCNLPSLRVLLFSSWITRLQQCVIPVVDDVDIHSLAFIFCFFTMLVCCYQLLLLSLLSQLSPIHLLLPPLFTFRLLLLLFCRPIRIEWCGGGSRRGNTARTSDTHTQDATPRAQGRSVKTIGATQITHSHRSPSHHHFASPRARYMCRQGTRNNSSNEELIMSHKITFFCCSSKNIRRTAVADGTRFSFSPWWPSSNLYPIPL